VLAGERAEKGHEDLHFALDWEEHSRGRDYLFLGYELARRKINLGLRYLEFDRVAPEECVWRVLLRRSVTPTPKRLSLFRLQWAR
jgi:hypothetical protein